MNDMGKCVDPGYYEYTEITVCGKCFHKDVCGDKDYLMQNECSNFVNADDLTALVRAREEGLPIIQETEDDMEFMHYLCPKCKVILHQHYKKSREKMRYNQKYCHECGQKIDWSAAREAAANALREGEK